MFMGSFDDVALTVFVLLMSVNMTFIAMESIGLINPNQIVTDSALIPDEAYRNSQITQDPSNISTTLPDKSQANTGIFQLLGDSTVKLIFNLAFGWTNLINSIFIPIGLGWITMIITPILLFFQGYMVLRITQMLIGTLRGVV